MMRTLLYGMLICVGLSPLTARAQKQGDFVPLNAAKARRFVLLEENAKPPKKDKKAPAAAVTEALLGLAYRDFDNDGMIDLVISNRGPLIGITAAPADAVLKAQLGIKQGLVVNAVVKKSPANLAGVKQHDLLLMVDEKPLATLADLEKQLNRPKKVAIRLKVLREGAARQLTIRPTMWSLPDITKKAITFVAQRGEQRWIGVHATPADATLRKQLRLADGQGLVITQVYKGTPAEKKGLRKSDILLTVAGKTVGRIQDLRKVVNDPKNKSIKLTFLRAGKRAILELKAVDRHALTGRFTDLEANIYGLSGSGEFFLAPAVVTQGARSWTHAFQPNYPRFLTNQSYPRAVYTVPADAKKKASRKKKSAKPSVEQILKQIDELRRQVQQLK